MARTIVVCGYGPGISHAVAQKFGSEGFRVALVARTREKVEEGARALAASGIEARAIACDLGDVAEVERALAEVRSSLGPITVLHWNAYVGLAGDLTTAPPGDLRKVVDVAVHGLVAAVQAALPDLRSQEGAAVLITGGAFALYDAKVDAMIVQWNAMGLAVAKAAQRKLAAVLHHKLKTDGIYVGEVLVAGAVKGTAFDGGQAKLEPSTIADRFWQIYGARTEPSVTVAG